MASIPGLSFCPANEESDDGIEIPSFITTFTIPQSHVYGNTKRITDYEKLGKIAEGSFGAIYKGKNKETQEIVALKKFKITSYDYGFPRVVLREMNILRTLKHDNIVNSYGTVAGKSLESNYLVMEYSACTLKELFDKNADVIHQKPVVKFILKQVLQGLVFTHSALIVHRNINPENIVFTEKGVVKLTGFHASRFYNGGNMTPEVNDLMYRAPELLFGVKSYGLAVDMWSTGCVLAYLLLKEPLIVGESELDVFGSMFNVLGTPSENIWPGFDEIFKLFDNNTRCISEPKPYSEIKLYFAKESLAAKVIVENLLVYCPEGRSQASECLTSPYFDENPPACPLDFLVPVIQKAAALGEPINTESISPMEMKSASDIIGSVPVSTPEPKLESASDIIGSAPVSTQELKLESTSDIIGSVPVSTQDPKLESASDIIGSVPVSTQEPKLESASDIIGSVPVSTQEPKLESASDIIGSVRVSTPEPKLESASNIIGSVPVSTQEPKLESASEIIGSAPVSTPEPKLESVPDIIRSAPVSTPEPNLESAPDITGETGPDIKI